MVRKHELATLLYKVAVLLEARHGRIQPVGARTVRLVHTLLAVLLVSTLASGAAAAAATPSLTRYPYLTDSIQTSVTVNWATTTAGGTLGSVTWGPAASCLAHLGLEVLRYQT